VRSPAASVSPFSTACPPPPIHSIVGLLPRRVAVNIAAERGRAADGGAGEGAVEQLRPEAGRERRGRGRRGRASWRLG
jgi:hypothetical protein